MADDYVAAIERRVAAATRDELRVLIGFFRTPSLRTHHAGLLTVLERELATRASADAELAARLRQLARKIQEEP